MKKKKKKKKDIGRKGVNDLLKMDNRSSVNLEGHPSPNSPGQSVLNIMILSKTGPLTLIWPTELPVPFHSKGALKYNVKTSHTPPFTVQTFKIDI